jgi:hypothetical protein
VIGGLAVAAMIAGILGLRRDMRGGARLSAVIGAVLLLVGGGTLAGVLQSSTSMIEREKKPPARTRTHDRLKTGSLTVGDLRKSDERTKATWSRP